MNREDIIKLIEDNGLNLYGIHPMQDLHGNIERFVELVSAAEREACAKECDEFMFSPSKNPDKAELDGIRLGSRLCAGAIRARTKQILGIKPYK